MNYREIADLIRKNVCLANEWAKGQHHERG